MRATSNDTKLYFFAPVFKNANVTVKLFNETSKAETYQNTLTINVESFYSFIEDVNGFNLTDGNNYILEINDNYRATVYCVDVLPKVYNKEKRINTNNEYITI